MLEKSSKWSFFFINYKILELLLLEFIKLTYDENIVSKLLSM